MSELDRTRAAILAECLRALEGGASLEDCLARYPEHTEALRPYLEVRTRLLSLETPEPPAAAYATGRQALLERVASSEPAAGRRWRFVPRLPLPSVGGWQRLESPLALFAAASAVLLLLAGGALGASAAGGFDPAQDVLSTFGIGDDPSDGDQAASPNADQGADNAADGIGNAPTAVPGRERASDRAAEGGADATLGPPQEIPGVGLCFAEGELPDLPDEALEHVPDAGVCIPEGLLDHASDGRPCVPESLLQRFPELQPYVDGVPSCEDSGSSPAELPTPPASPPQAPPTEYAPDLPDQADERPPFAP